MKNKTLLHLFSLLIIISSCVKDNDLVLLATVTPSKVNLVFPENNSECTEGIIISETESDVTFEWTNAEIGDRYELTLTNLATNQQSTHISQTNSNQIRLQRGTPYQWKITTSLSQSNIETDSDEGAFYNSGTAVESFVPFPALITSPKNGEEINTSVEPITLEWEGDDLDDDIVGYDCYFAETNPPEIVAENLSNMTLSDVAIENGKTYYWMIVTKDSKGNQSRSIVSTFSVSE